MQNTTNTVVLIAALITLATALVPFVKWAWRTHGVRTFDGKKAHHNELVEQAKWYEGRLHKLHGLRVHLMNCLEPDRFRLAEWISQLDSRDAEWARKIEDMKLLITACEQKEEECLRNAEQAREWAEDVARRVLFW